MLAGYASKAAQAMGDAYLLPAIAAVVLGGASILGGRGSYLGTIAGVILITLLQSILSVIQIRRRAGRSPTASSSSRCCCCTGERAGRVRPAKIRLMLQTLAPGPWPNEYRTRAKSTVSASGVDA